MVNSLLLCGSIVRLGKRGHIWDGSSFWVYYILLYYGFGSKSGFGYVITLVPVGLNDVGVQNLYPHHYKPAK